MNARRLVIAGVASIAVTLLAAWIVSNTYWQDVSVPSPLRGEAARDPHYAAKALVRALGGTASESTLFAAPATHSVIYLVELELGPGRSAAPPARGLGAPPAAGWCWTTPVFFLGEEFTAWSGIAEVELNESDATPARALETLPEDECRLHHRNGQRTPRRRGRTTHLPAVRFQRALDCHQHAAAVMAGTG